MIDWMKERLVPGTGGGEDDLLLEIVVFIGKKISAYKS